MTTAGLLLALSLASPSSAPGRPTAPPPPRRHDARPEEAGRVPGGRQTPRATEALLRRLQPELDADPRFALDAIYVLLGHRRFSEATDAVEPASPRGCRRACASSGQPLRRPRTRSSSGASPRLVFVQGLLTARAGPKDEALRLLQQADGYGFPPLDSPLMLLAADGLSELQEHALAAQAYRAFLERSPADVEGAAAPRGRPLLVRPGRGRGEGAPGGAPARTGHAPGPLLPRRRALRAEARRRGADAPGAGAGARPGLRRLPGQARPHRLPGGRRPPVRVLAREGGGARPGTTSRRTWSPGCSRTGPAGTSRRSSTCPASSEQSPAYAKAQYQLALAYQRSGNAPKAREHLEIYNQLIQEQKARTSACAERRSSPGGLVRPARRPPSRRTRAARADRGPAARRWPGATSSAWRVASMASASLPVCA